MPLESEIPTAWKMRFAAHAGLKSPDTPLFEHGSGSGDPVVQIGYAAALGFAGLEDNSLKTRPAPVQARMGAELARHGLQMGCFVNNPAHWNQPLWGRRDEDARAILAQDLADSIATAQRVGGRYCTVVTGRDPAVPFEQQCAAMVENLKRCGETAERAGLVLAVETVDDRFWPGMLLNHIADAYRVVREADCPAVRLVFDIGHVQAMDGDIVANLERAWDEIAIIQAADQPGRLELGSGELDWVEILRHIRGRGYTGLIELEHLLSDPSPAGERAMLAKLTEINRTLRTSAL